MKNNFEHYASVNLDDYMAANNFRIAPENKGQYLAGFSEVPVTIELQDECKSKLPFNVDSDNMVFAFAIATSKTEENGKSFADIPNVTSISLFDWLDKFLLVFNTKKGKTSFIVENEKVIKLLSNCQIPYQMLK